MSYKLSAKQFESACQLGDAERYDYFMDKVSSWEKIWSLHSDDGWVELSSEEGDICLPIWPHPDFAAAWATGDWADCEPKSIDLEVWLERWTPGLEEDDTLLVVFPVDDGNGIVQTPEEVHESIMAEFD